MQEQPEHVMTVPLMDTNFATTVPVVGKTNYGDPIYKTPTNAWTANFAQEFAIGSFTWSVANSTGNNLYNNNNLYPYTTNGATIPWHTWLIAHYMAIECKYDLMIELVKHTAHRGSLSVVMTIEPPTPLTISSGMGPLVIVDIAGANEFVIPIPCVYSNSAKFYMSSSRDLQTDLTVPTNVPRMLDILSALHINVNTPLVASSMLPDEITGIVKLRPIMSTLKLYQPILPSISKFNTNYRNTNRWNNT